ncbi:tRNA(Ile)-lysidine synthetase, partial [Salmonella enterica subsp. enterica serovar Irumu]|nr:tRNA(Ile)-lysidine synthetase [Salmonella enterica subsp. enterica serovar Irumu]
MTTLTLNTSLLSSRRILAAFSVGLDSPVLLHPLVLWRERRPDVTLRAIH